MAPAFGSQKLISRPKYLGQKDSPISFQDICQHISTPDTVAHHFVKIIVTGAGLIATDSIILYPPQLARASCALIADNGALIYSRRVGVNLKVLVDLSADKLFWVILQDSLLVLSRMKFNVWFVRDTKLL